MPPVRQSQSQVWHPPRTYPSNAAATASIERFDPTALRCEVLRRYALESSRSMAGREQLGSAGLNSAGDDWEQLLQWCASIASAVWRRLGCHHRVEATETTAPAAAAGTAAAADGSMATPASGSGEQAARSNSGNVATTNTDSTARTSTPHDSSGLASTNETVPAVSATQADVGKAASETAASGLLGHVKSAVMLARGVRDKVVKYVQLSTFLAFPKDSLFADPAVEELFQRHCMQSWTPQLDLSVAAVVQMLAWDLAAGFGHRLGLVLRFYAAFAARVLFHKALFLALRGRPQGWRRCRGLLLCGFLLGRGVVCHPVLPAAFPDTGQDSSVNPDLPWLLYEIAQSGVVATGLILALQLHTLDTLLLCITHGVACACWAGFAAIHFTSIDAWWHHLAVVHLLVTCICFWQQHERERLSRHAFEQELLMERGRLLHASECLIRQGTQVDFGIGIQLLYQARSVEHLNF